MASDLPQVVLSKLTSNVIFFNFILPFLIKLIYNFILDIPHPFMRSKTYRVALRTNEVKLNCSFVANPVSPITWLFMPRRITQRKNSENDYFAWTLINSMASFFDAAAFTLNTTASAIAKLSLSKYQIYERMFPHNQINSILIIKVRSNQIKTYA